MQRVFVFPGQGSQSVGMLAGLAQQDRVIADTFAEASAVLGYDLWQLLEQGPAELLNETERTQPAMLVAGIATWRYWLKQGGPAPDAVCGHSLGEFSALVAASALEFGAAVGLVRERARRMQEAVPAGVGAIAAVLGLEDEAVAAACIEAAQGEVVEPVNFNSPGQAVIAGHATAVQRALESCRARGAKRAVLLPMSVPAHSSLMKPAAEQFATPLAAVQLQVPRIAFWSPVDCLQQEDPEAIRRLLARQLVSPVRWTDLIRTLALAGANTFVECGPGKILTGLNRRIEKRPEINCLALQDVASVQAALTQLELTTQEMNMTETLKGETALVTGASRGIGRAIALRLAAAGAKVVGTATTAEGAAQIGAALAAQGGRGEVLNVSTAGSLEALVGVLDAAGDMPTILVNNAAITRDTLLLRMKDDDWNQVIDTNLSANFRISKVCVKRMMKERKGRIINITSVVGLMGNAGQVNYAAAKAGVVGLTKSMARELASRNITVNAVAPGFIDTDMTKGLPQEQKESLLKQIPAGRLGSPEDIAEAVAFLASPAAGYITGQTLSVNGGMLMP